MANINILPDIFFISYHHMFHKNILGFTGDDGKLIRPGFKDIDHMHEIMVERHNTVVKKTSSKVYFIGDFTMHYGEKADLLLSRFNGRKRLIPGNHDDLTKKLEFFKRHFKKIMIWRIFK